MVFLFSLNSWTWLCRLAPELGLSRVPFWRPNVAFLCYIFKHLWKLKLNCTVQSYFRLSEAMWLEEDEPRSPDISIASPLLRQAHRQTGRKRLKLAAEKQQSSALQAPLRLRQACSRTAAPLWPTSDQTNNVMECFFGCFCCVSACEVPWVCEGASDRASVCVCVSSIKFNPINHSHREITPPRVIAVIDLSIIHTNNSWNCSTSWSPRKHSPGTNTMLAISWGCHEMQ